MPPKPFEDLEQRRRMMLDERRDRRKKCNACGKPIRPVGESEITCDGSSTETCGNNTCYNVSTVANVTQNPVMFPEVRSHLIFVSKVLDFMEDREIVITPLVPVPQEITTEISITFTGVQNSGLDDENEVAFTETVLDFPADILGLHEPLILIFNSTHKH